jgi:hypothetical protein
MPHITLNAEQTALLTTSLDPVEIRDCTGRVVAVVVPTWSREDIEEAKRILADPNTEWFTSEEVRAHLQSLEKE